MDVRIVKKDGVFDARLRHRLHDFARARRTAGMQQHPVLSFRRWFDFIGTHKAKYYHIQCISQARPSADPILTLILIPFSLIMITDTTPAAPLAKLCRRSVTSMPGFRGKVPVSIAAGFL
jgi:hypothetical protein